MRSSIRLLPMVLAGCLAGCAATDGGRAADDPGAAPVPSAATPAETPRYVLGHAATRIDGTPEALDRYQGRVVLVVNTASACGLTPQLAELETLFRERLGEGFVVLGFPANDFMGQEPLANDEIMDFCAREHGVTFPLFEKTTVVGDAPHPLFAQLAELEGPPTWNFTKYLVDRQGVVVARFDPRTRPTDPVVVARIDELLAAPAAGG